MNSAVHTLISRGFVTSANHALALDGNGNPLPWLSYPAIEYLSGLNLREKTVFEYGSGCSTLYWSERCSRVVSVEHDKVWCEKLQESALASSIQNCRVLLREGESEYLRAIHEENCPYDVVIVDGGFNRKRMAEHALQRLAPGGIIVLDNSDCHVGAAEVLRNADLIQIDFCGFAPGNELEQVTSLFLRRDFRFPPLERWQPRKTPWCMPHLVDE